MGCKQGEKLEKNLKVKRIQHKEWWGMWIRDKEEWRGYETEREKMEETREKNGDSDGTRGRGERESKRNFHYCSSHPNGMGFCLQGNWEGLGKLRNGENQDSKRGGGKFAQPFSSHPPSKPYVPSSFLSIIDILLYIMYIDSISVLSIYIVPMFKSSLYCK